jgi:hypothetical protein
MSKRSEISFERVADWVEGRLSEEEARAVEEQVAVAGEAAQAEVQWLRALARVSRETVFDGPSSETREELMRRFHAYGERRRSPGFLQRLVASLSFDSGLQPAFGVRSSDSQEAALRHLIYTTDAVEIALNIRRRLGDGRLDLDGQVFPADDTDPASFSIWLLSGVDEVSLTTSDELGEYSFESVPPGTYQILISSDRVEILISPVELRP